MHEAVLVLDCGATNVKACLVAANGSILSTASRPNHTVPDPDYPNGLIWDADDIWEKMSSCARQAVADCNHIQLRAVTVTTFGVDGAAMKKNGEFCHPVISWQCNRTKITEQQIDRYLNKDWLYGITGLQSYSFNTLFRLIWFLENKPEVIEKMEQYVFMPSLFLYRLCGEFVTDATMAGTSMLTNLMGRRFSDEILGKFQLSPDIFPPWVEPGTCVGKVHEQAAGELGIETGIPVVAAGHDTQFAILASGAQINQPVLSSGTWEILMVRTPSQGLLMPRRNDGITFELDVMPGLVNPGLQWVASGVLEWIGRTFFSELGESHSRYAEMIAEASMVPPGSRGLTCVPEIYAGGLSSRGSSFAGFSHESTRGQFYRAGIESLCYYLKYALEMLQQTGNQRAHDMICVGGGTRNPLWNQIRADVTGIPVKNTDISEATALGAALAAFTGIGTFKNITEAISAVTYAYDLYEPGTDSAIYADSYACFREKYL